MPVWSRRIRSAIVGLVVLAAGLSIFYIHFWGPLERMPQIARSRAERAGGQWVELSQVSPWFLDAIIATEDQSFWTNWGISFEGIARAMVVDIREGRFAQGGSTLTQELVRDLLLSPVKTIPRKVTGTLLSLLVARIYSKSQVLTMYVNEVYLGDGAYGIENASRRYFGVAPQSLTLPEASLLAGLPVAPSALNPLRHFHAAKARQQEVLASMVANHLISAALAAKAWKAPLPLKRRGALLPSRSS